MQGLQKIKKYACLMNQYSNKTAWSSPEILGNPKVGYVPDVKESDEVFSYGTILWEIYTGSIPFEGVPLSKITNTIVTE